MLIAAPWVAMAGMAAMWPRRKGDVSVAAPVRAPVPAPPPPPTPDQIAGAEPGRGREANAPWRVPLPGWKDILWRTYRNYGRDGLPAVAGGATFYLLLAAFPAAAAFVSIYGLFLDMDTIGSVLGQLSSVFPSDALSLIGAQMLRLAQQRHEVLSAAFAASTLLSAWSANSGMKALLIGLNVAYREREKRPFLQRSLITYAATISLVLVVTSATILTVAAPLALHTIGLHHVHLWWAPLRWGIVYAIAAGALSVIYRYGPSRRRPKWRWVAPGGALAALAWLGGSLVFTFYVDNFTHLGATYGSLGAVIGFMLWLWFSVMVVLIGAELSAEAEHQTACDTTAGPAKPLGERGALMADTVGAAFTVTPREARHLVRGFVERQAKTVRRALGLGRGAPPRKPGL